MDRMKESPTQEQGFTLIEVMVAVVITAIIAAAAFTILTTTTKSLRANEQTVDTQQNVRIAMEL
jgi:prepilin-type N-terminal cleavage/methylation domain-containing protein